MLVAASLLSNSLVDSFVPGTRLVRPGVSDIPLAHSRASLQAEKAKEEIFTLDFPSSEPYARVSLVFLAAMAMAPPPVLAAGPDWGLFEVSAPELARALL